MKSLLSLLIAQSLVLLFLLVGVVFYVSLEDSSTSPHISISASTSIKSTAAVDSTDTQATPLVENEVQVITPETAVASDQTQESVFSKPQAEASTSRKDAITDKNISNTTAAAPVINTEIHDEKIEPEISNQVTNSGEQISGVEVTTAGEKPPSEVQNKTSSEDSDNFQSVDPAVHSAQRESDELLSTHIVVAGDNLWKIAKAYGVSVSAIQLWNHLSEDAVLQIGQIIRLQSQDLQNTARPEQISLETPVTLAETATNDASLVPVTPTKEWIVDVARFDPGKDFEALAAAGDLLRAGLDVQLYKTSTAEIRIFGKKVSSSKEAVDQLKLIRRSIKNRGINPTVVEFSRADLGSLQPFNPPKKTTAIMDTKTELQPSEPVSMPEITEDKAQPKSTFFGFEVTPTEIDF